MDTSNWINLIAVIVAVVAAFIAWRSMFAARNSASEANTIQKRMLEIEEARETDRKTNLQPARFEAKTRWNVAGISTVEVYNLGQQPARTVSFFIGRRQLNGQLDELLPGESVTLSEIPPNLPQPIYLHIKWIDSRGVETSHNEKLSGTK